MFCGACHRKTIFRSIRGEPAARRETAKVPNQIENDYNFRPVMLIVQATGMSSTECVNTIVTYLHVTAQK